MPFDFDFRSRRPDGPLGRAVESIWYARGTVPYRRERIAPTGSTVAVIVLGEPLVQTADDGHGDPVRTDTGLLVGPHDRPIVNEPTGETFAVGIVTTSVGARAALGVRPAQHRGRVVELLPTWDRAAALRGRLRSLDDPETMLAVVEAVLAEDLDLSVPALDRAERAVMLLEEDPTRPLASIADVLGVSTAQLGRDVSRIVGTSPRVLSRVLRMRRLLAGIDALGDVGWAGLAADLGWYDQSHLIRDFTRHTGVTPTAYLAAQRAYTRDTADAVDTAGFVPSDERR